MIERTSMRFGNEIRQFCQSLSKLYPDSTAIVCGSTSRAEHMPWSDVDIVVVADFKLPFLERLGELAKLNVTSAPLEVVGYTAEEFISMLDRLDAKLIEAMEFGIPVLSGSVMPRLVSKFRELKEKGLTRSSCTYLLSKSNT